MSMAPAILPSPSDPLGSMLSPRPLFALLLASTLAAIAAPSIRRDGWSFDRSDLIV